MSDIDVLWRLEKESWCDATRTDREIIYQNILQYPNNDFVITSESEGDIIAVIYTQRIDGIERIDECSSVKGSNGIRSKNGSSILLLRVNSFQNTKYGNIAAGAILRDFVLSYAKKLGMSIVCAVTRCSNFTLQSSTELVNKVNYLEYVSKHKSSKTAHDNGLNFHLMQGASIVKCIEGWRPGDHSNLGYGVLIVYKLNINTEKTSPSSLNSITKTKHYDIHEIESMIVKCVRNILKLQKEPDRDAPLMVLGFDSLLITPLAKEIGLF